MNISRGGIFVANLDPVTGSEISKTRPVLVVSNDRNNAFAATVTVLPITSQHLGKIFPFEVFLSKGTGNLPKDSKVKADQIRTLDKRRLIAFVGNLSEAEVERIDGAVRIHLALC
jgi:mRNA interferase MazF